MPVGIKGELLAQLIYENDEAFFPLPSSSKVNETTNEITNINGAFEVWMQANI